MPGPASPARSALSTSTVASDAPARGRTPGWAPWAAAAVGLTASALLLWLVVGMARRYGAGRGGD